jgi:hypothetical protein
MAGQLKVDSINADSNLALKIANTAVAFIDSNGLRPTSGNVSLDSTGTTGVGSPAANTLVGYTGGVERLRVTSAGDVGIGTTNPVAGTGFTAQRKLIQVYSSTGSGNAQVHLGGTSGTMLDHDDSNYTIATLRNLYGASDARALMQIQSGYMTFGTGTSYTEAMRIDSSGRVTKPLQPAFRATLTSSVTGLADSAAIVFNSALTNIGSSYNTSTGRFTAPVAGFYQFNMSFLYQNVSAGQSCEASLYLNGTNSGGLSFGPRVKYQTDYTGYSGYVSMSASISFYLNASDYVSVHSIAGRSFEVYGSASGVWSNFSGFLVS